MSVLKGIDQNIQGKPLEAKAPSVLFPNKQELEKQLEKAEARLPKTISEKEKNNAIKNDLAKSERIRLEQLGVAGRLYERTISQSLILTSNCLEVLSLAGFSLASAVVSLFGNPKLSEQVLNWGIENTKQYANRICPTGSIIAERSNLINNSDGNELYSLAKLALGVITFPTTLILSNALGVISTLIEEGDRARIKNLRYSEYLKNIEENPSTFRDGLNLSCFILITALTAGRGKVPIPMAIRSYRFIANITSSLGMGGFGALGEQLMRVGDQELGGFRSRVLLSDTIQGALASSIFGYGMSRVQMRTLKNIADATDGSGDLFDALTEYKRIGVEDKSLSLVTKVARGSGLFLKAGTAVYDMKDNFTVDRISTKYENLKSDQVENTINLDLQDTHPQPTRQGEFLRSNGLQVKTTAVAGFVTQVCDSINFAFVGSGEIGDKAFELLDHARIISDVGKKLDLKISIPGTVVLSEEVIQEILSLSGLGDGLLETEKLFKEKEIKERLGNFLLSDTRAERFKEILTFVLKDRFAESSYFCIRSSAVKDATGHGTYRSNPSIAKEESMIRNFADVVASYFSEEACELRKERKLEEGFAVMIQPIVGERFETRNGGVIFGPRLSGNGVVVEDTEKYFQNIVIGFGGGVSSGPAPVRIYQKDVNLKAGQLSEILNLITNKADEIVRKTGGYYPNNSLISSSGNVRGLFVSESGDLRVFAFTEHFISEINKLDKYFEAMREIKESSGKSNLYLEWAYANGELFVLQIAEVLPKAFFNIEQSKLDTALLKTGEYKEGYVLGSGEKRCSKILFCDTYEQLLSLYERSKVADGASLFKGSILVVNSSLGKRIELVKHEITSDEIIKKLGIDVILEGGTGHMEDPRSHWLGALELRNVFFGVVGLPDHSRDFNSLPISLGATINEQLGIYVLESEDQDFLVSANQMAGLICVNVLPNEG